MWIRSRMKGSKARSFLFHSSPSHPHQSGPVLSSLPLQSPHRSHFLLVTNKCGSQQGFVGNRGEERYATPRSPPRPTPPPLLRRRPPAAAAAACPPDAPPPPAPAGVGPPDDVVLRRRRAGRVEARPRHVLRRVRSPGHRRGRLRVRRPWAVRIWSGDGGAERVHVREGPDLRGVLRGAVRGGAPLLHPWDLHQAHGHQLLPTQLRPPRRRRRPLQPPQPTPRHAHRGLREDRHLEGRQHARPVPPDPVRSGRGDPVHDGRVRGVPLGAGEQRGRIGGRDGGEGEGDPFRVAADGPQLGTELAHQRRPQGPAPLLPGHHQRRRHPHLLLRRPPRLVLRPDLRRQAVRPDPPALSGFNLSLFVYVAPSLCSVPEENRPPF